MKGIVVTSGDAVEIREFSAPLHKTLGQAVGGWIEIVRPLTVKRPYVMIVNEEGLLMGLELNKYGSAIYGTAIHGQPIVGDIVIMKEGFVGGEPDIVGLTDEEADTIYAEIFNFLRPVRQFKGMVLRG